MSFSCQQTGRLVAQTKFGEHPYSQTRENQCKITLTEDNWYEDFVLPVYATPDGKLDGDRDVFLTVKLVLDGLFHKHTEMGKVS